MCVKRETYKVRRWSIICSPEVTENTEPILVTLRYPVSWTPHKITTKCCRPIPSCRASSHFKHWGWKYTAVQFVWIPIECCCELHRTSRPVLTQNTQSNTSWRKMHNEELRFTADHTECYSGYETNSIGKCKAKKSSQDADVRIILTQIKPFIVQLMHM